MTRRALTLKWLFYGLWTLLFLLLQQLVLPFLRLWDVHPFLLPPLAAIAASFEGRREGLTYALVLGLVCSLLFDGVFPCSYAVILLLCALAAGVSAHRLIMPGPVCSLVVSAMALLLNGIVSGMALSYSHGAPFTAALSLTVRELLISLPFAMLVHLAFFRVHRRFAKR